MEKIFLLLIYSLSVSAFAQTTILKIEQGFVQGTSLPGVNRFLAIPYAQPPIGYLRWKAPRNPFAWDGILDATKPGPVCAQLGNIFSTAPPSEYGKAFGSEDCLYLNVWAPTAERRHLLPMVLWIHGGSNSMGTANDPIYDGQRISQESNAIFISANYRLGIFGSFYLPQIQGGDPLDDSGNFVTLDLLKALEWVARNASYFGGDPNNITIMGQSAGCINVWGLIQSPLAQGKFQRAVCLSGLPNTYPKEIAEGHANQFLSKLLVQDSLIPSESEGLAFIKTRDPLWIKNYLLGKSTSELLQIPSDLIPVQHISDGHVLPANGFLDFLQGHFNQVPMIIGTTADDASILAYQLLPNFNQAHFWDLVNSDRKDLKLADLINPFAYPAFILSSGSLSLSLAADLDSMCDELQFHVPRLYRSKFTWKHTPQPWRELFGSMHAMDLLLLMGNFITDRPNIGRFAWDAANESSRETLHQEMQTGFTHFFQDGSVADWPVWSAERKAKVWR